MRSALRALLAGGLGFAASLIVAACGGSAVLSADQAGAISAQLTRLQTSVNGGDCTGVVSSLDQLAGQISNVSNATAKNNLAEGYNTLERQATAKCPASAPQTTSTPATAKTTTTKTKTATTTTATTQSTTTPTTPTTTSPATTPAGPGTNTNAGPGSGGAGLGPGNSGAAPGHNKGNGNGP